jgi:hypothetical protein
MSVVRKLLSRKEIQMAAAPPDSPAMATGETAANSSAHAAALWVCPKLSRIFCSSAIQQEIIYRVLPISRAHVSPAVATLDESSQRTTKAIGHIPENYPRPLRVESLAEIAAMGVSTLHHLFPDVDGNESSSASKAAPAAGVTLADARGRCRRFEDGI